MVSMVPFDGFAPCPNPAAAKTAEEVYARKLQSLFESWLGVPQAHSQPSVLLNTGHRIPLFGLGTFKADEKTTNEAVAAALQAGYRHIDCAQHYLNEPAIGHGLKAALDAGYAKREDVFVTSKLW